MDGWDRKAESGDPPRPWSPWQGLWSTYSTKNEEELIKHSFLRIGKNDGFRNDQTMIIWMIKPPKLYVWKK